MNFSVEIDFLDIFPLSDLTETYICFFVVLTLYNALEKYMSEEKIWYVLCLCSITVTCLSYIWILMYVNVCLVSVFWHDRYTPTPCFQSYSFLSNQFKITVVISTSLVHIQINEYNWRKGLCIIIMIPNICINIS